jgi:hypothetical protein
MYDPPLTLPMPKIINLLTDMKEERDVAWTDSWVVDPIKKIITEFEASLKKYPPIPMGTPDPYTPLMPQRTGEEQQSRNPATMDFLMKD